jgi:hypothetical protein
MERMYNEYAETRDAIKAMESLSKEEIVLWLNGAEAEYIKQKKI